MADIVDRKTRSRMMAAVRSKNTRPEVLVRSALHRAGFRFRVHDRRLIGTPDIVLTRYKTVIFCSGCFWHGHACAKGALPATNRRFWSTKIRSNRLRDRRVFRTLKAEGWRVEVLWECELHSPSVLRALIRRMSRRR